MADEFEGDLTGAVFWGADLQGARFRDVNLRDVKVSHAWLVDVDIDAFVERVVINGVDVTAFVNQHDPWYPLRTVLRVSDAESMRTGWAALTDAWTDTIASAERLPADDLLVSVGGEWSFVDTLRHLIMATDKWLTVPILGGSFHRFGLPNTGSRDFPWPGLDLDSAPSAADVLAARAERVERVRAYLAGVTAADLDRTVDVLENGPHAIRDCIATVFEEEFWHNRYARRDLAELDAVR